MPDINSPEYISQRPSLQDLLSHEVDPDTALFQIQLGEDIKGMVDAMEVGNVNLIHLNGGDVNDNRDQRVLVAKVEDRVSGSRILRPSVSHLVALFNRSSIDALVLAPVNRDFSGCPRYVFARSSKTPISDPTEHSHVTDEQILELFRRSGSIGCLGSIPFVAHQAKSDMALEAGPYCRQNGVVVYRSHDEYGLYIRRI